MSQEELLKRQQQVLYDKKWRKFLRRTWVFRWIPFVDFALAAGSMATGNVHEDSDFDVIVGVRYGRIFTARFFCAIAFGFFGWRRTKLDHQETAMDKVCLNHFVTEKSYRLSPPRNDYWKNLYLNLVPVFGEPAIIQKFWDANADWMKEKKVYSDDLRHLYRKSAWKKKAYEWLLAGKIGELAERWLKKIQIRRIEKSLKNSLGYMPRIRYGDEELEFHPDTARITTAF